MGIWEVCPTAELPLVALAHLLVTTLATVDLRGNKLSLPVKPIDTM